MKIGEEQYLSMLFAAQAAELGVVVRTSSPDRLRQRLYRIRRETGDFDNLAFLIPKEPDQLWIVKQEIDDAA